MTICGTSMPAGTAAVEARAAPRNQAARPAARTAGGSECGMPLAHSAAVIVSQGESSTVASGE